MAPFSTFWGDYLHGLWITWETTATDGAGNAYATGSINMKINFQANYRARMYTWLNTAATPTADVPNATTPTRDFDYALTTTPGATYTSSNPTWAFYVAWTNPT